MFGSNAGDGYDDRRTTVYLLLYIVVEKLMNFLNFLYFLVFNFTKYHTSYTTS